MSDPDPAICPEDLFDPNAAIVAIRAEVKVFLGEADGEDLAPLRVVELAQAIAELCDHLANGGEEPEAWDMDRSAASSSAYEETALQEESDDLLEDLTQNVSLVLDTETTDYLGLDLAEAFRDLDDHLSATHVCPDEWGACP